MIKVILGEGMVSVEAKSKRAGSAVSAAAAAGHTTGRDQNNADDRAESSKAKARVRIRVR